MSRYSRIKYSGISDAGLVNNAGTVSGDDLDLSPSQEWIDYCQALRDIPQQEGFPFDIQWPIEPNE